MKRLAQRLRKNQATFKEMAKGAEKPGKQVVITYYDGISEGYRRSAMAVEHSFKSTKARLKKRMDEYSAEQRANCTGDPFYAARCEGIATATRWSMEDLDR